MEVVLTTVAAVSRDTVRNQLSPRACSGSTDSLSWCASCRGGVSARTTVLLSLEPRTPPACMRASSSVGWDGEPARRAENDVRLSSCSGFASDMDVRGKLPRDLPPDFMKRGAGCGAAEVSGGESNEKALVLKAIQRVLPASL
jgi:hypothetical protein